MSGDEIKRAVREAIREEAESGSMCPRCCTVCDMDAHEHRDHHQTLRKITTEEIEADHRFVSEARSAVKEGKRVFGLELVKHAATALMTAGALYVAMKAGK